MRQGPPNGRRGPRRPHQGGGERNGNGGSSGHSGGHSAPRGEQRRSAASLRSQNFDSNGPDVRVRGNAWQVHEKYQSLARDAQMAGDRVAAENFLQHAEHYYRIIEAINEATAAEQAARGYSAPPEQRPAYPTPVTEGAQVEMVGGAQPFPSPEVLTAPPLAAQQPQQAQESENRNPFFTPEEAAEGDSAAQPARVAGF